MSVPTMLQKYSWELELELSTLTQQKNKLFLHCEKYGRSQTMLIKNFGDSNKQMTSKKLNKQCFTKRSREEEMKKNKHKYLPTLQGVGVPTESPVITAIHVVCKLDKGEYVELWHFTNNRLDNTLDTSTSVDPDTMVMSCLPDGSMAWVSAAAARSSTKLVEDQNLIFEDFCQAAPRFVEAIQQANWPDN
ncbi:hypothetical protein PAXRUDRAFT_13550 [Paxillus rubicundulus Ve08.2h10]|uniref:Unplaced genomic scaffold scaffold_517, whole genome shotgun sequence n=1 Tax=Paxillus rubicundulus Ve08.2h10 TaxID=930991 RepID=A0A0D0DTH5_9AGAM|nr:hypothetical protein PAXRUDRAFT_13550 [Paxillus rubicundulus Ve08.2h10]